MKANKTSQIYTAPSQALKIKRNSYHNKSFKKMCWSNLRLNLNNMQGASKQSKHSTLWITLIVCLLCYGINCQGEPQETFQFHQSAHCHSSGNI